MNELLIGLAAAGGLVISAALALLGTRGGNRVAREKNVLDAYGSYTDDLREEKADMKKEIAELRARNDTLTVQLAASDAANKVLRDENITLHEENVALTAAGQAPPRGRPE